MGLSSSQSRFLTLTARLCDLELKAQNIQHQKIRLSGCGHKQAEKTGDMILVVEVKIPQTLTEEELSLYSRLRDINNDTSYSF